MDDETIELIRKYNKVQSKFGPINQEPIIRPAPVDDETEYNELFAKLAGESYNPINERDDIGDYKYLQNESTDDLAVFESPKDYHVSIRGTSKENIIPSTYQDILVASGSLGSLIPDQLGLGLIDIKQKIDKLKKNKPVSVSGHSLGGSKASMLGVLDDELQVYTYNKGDALPFIGDTIKCAISGCKNIKNYRIAGDIVSGIGAIYSPQNIETLAPKQLSVEKEKMFSATENIVPKNIYIPHAMEQFTDRDKVYPISTFPRKLYSQVGHYAGIGLGIYYGPQILSNLAGSSIKPIIDTLIEQGDMEDKLLKKYEIEKERINEEIEYITNEESNILYDEIQRKYVDNLKKIPVINKYIPTNALKNIKYYSSKLHNMGTTGAIGGYIGSNFGGYIYDVLNYSGLDNLEPF